MLCYMYINEFYRIYIYILGLEDALGTMDFKVAGNETGITTFQLDIKSEGLTLGKLFISIYSKLIMNYMN